MVEAEKAEPSSSSGKDAAKPVEVEAVKDVEVKDAEAKEVKDVEPAAPSEAPAAAAAAPAVPAAAPAEAPPAPAPAEVPPAAAPAEAPPTEAKDCRVPKVLKHPRGMRSGLRLLLRLCSLHRWHRLSFEGALLLHCLHH